MVRDRPIDLFSMVMTAPDWARPLMPPVVFDCALATLVTASDATEAANAIVNACDKTVFLNIVIILIISVSWQIARVKVARTNTGIYTNPATFVLIFTRKD